MNSSPHPLFGLVVSLAFLSLSPITAQALNPKSDDSPENQPINLKIFHKYSVGSPFRPSEMSREKMVLEMQANDLVRQQFLHEKSTEPIGPGGPNLYIPPYLVAAEIGTPPQTLFLGLDTSWDVSYVPCAGCVGCSPSATLFDPAMSTSYRALNCSSFECQELVRNPTCEVQDVLCTSQRTHDSSSVALKLLEDTVTLGSRDSTFVNPNFTFDCIQNASGIYSLLPNGVLGLGFGLLSLLSQTRTLYTFSYCLPYFISSIGANSSSSSPPGSLIIGQTGQPEIPNYTQTLINSNRPSLYYVNMTGIMVGDVSVNIPLSSVTFNYSALSGTVFDSGTDFTRLAEPVYNAVRDEFRNQVDSDLASPWLPGFDTCYLGPFIAPDMTFLFTDMNMTLTPENILIYSPSGDIACLAMMVAERINDDDDSELNVIGNYQQQNHRILYEFFHGTMAVTSELCS